MNQRSLHVPGRTGRARLRIAALVAVGCLAATSCTGNDEKAAPTTTSGKSTAVTDGGKTPPPKNTSVPSPEDSLIDFGNGVRPVNFRGGAVPAKAFVDVSSKGNVETPMEVLFPAGVDAKLSDRARNQVRTVVAAATDERGETPRADPFWVQHNADGDVALLVIIDNPTKDDLKNLSVRAELLKPDGTSNGIAEFKIPAKELDGLPAGDAAFLVLTVSEDRLEDPKSDVTRGGVRLDLQYT